MCHKTLTNTDGFGFSGRIAAAEEKVISQIILFEIGKKVEAAR
jgi:hypothetical protein